MSEYAETLAPEDTESIKRASTRKRVVILTTVCAVVIGVRLLWKNPDPPKAPDHSDHPFRAIPGVLKNLSETDKRKLTSQQLAMLQEADRNALRLPGSSDALAKNVYQPVEAPVQIANEMKVEAKKFEYAQRREIRSNLPTPDFQTFSKDTLIIFSKGGHLKAEEAVRSNGEVQIKIDQNMRAHVPRKIVRSITNNAAMWTEPIPPGFRQLKPAKGITVVLSARIANRITLNKDPDEI